MTQAMMASINDCTVLQVHLRNRRSLGPFVLYERAQMGCVCVFVCVCNKSGKAWTREIHTKFMRVI